MTTQGRGVKSAPAKALRRDRRALRRGPGGPTGNGGAAATCPRGHVGTPRKLYLRSYGAAATKGEARDGWHPVALWCPSCGLAYNVNPDPSHRLAAARAGRPLRGQLRLPIRER